MAVSDLEELMSAIRHKARANDDDDDGDRAILSPEMQARVLTDMVPIVNRPCPFAVGDVVRTIKGYGVYIHISHKKMAVVTKVLPDTSGKLSDRKYGSPVEREDMVVLALVDGRWTEFTVDSWRFEKYDGPVA